MAEIMFESLKTPAMNSTIKEELSLYSSGRTTGIMIDSGEDSTNTVPIYEGNAIKNSVSQLNFGGKQITEYLLNTLNEKGFEFKTYAEREIVRDIKEKICYISLDFEDEIKKSKKCIKKYELPDGEEINIGNERFICPELLFHPNLINLKCNGIHENCYNSIEKCNVDIRKEIYSNIAFSGGSTMFEGIYERFFAELVLLAPSNTKIKCIFPPERKYSVWIGGSIISSLSTSEKLFITKQEYEEFGKKIINWVCI